MVKVTEREREGGERDRERERERERDREREGEEREREIERDRSVRQGVLTKWNRVTDSTKGQGNIQKIHTARGAVPVGSVACSTPAGR